MKLICTDIYRYYLTCAVLQGVVGKTAGATAYIQYDLIFKIKLKCLRHRGKLQSGPRYILLSSG